MYEKRITKQHNRNVSDKKEKQTNPWNWRNKNECPLNGNCKLQSVIYKCTVSATQTFKQRVYLGIVERNWKQRLYIHRQSFKDKRHKNGTTLSSYLWDLKENHNQIPKLTWPIVRFAPAYSNISKRCLLCLHEKLLIISYRKLLNKRSELMRINSCSVIVKVTISNPFLIFIAKFLYIKEYYVNIYLPDDRKIVKL